MCYFLYTYNLTMTSSVPSHDNYREVREESGKLLKELQSHFKAFNIYTREYVADIGHQHKGDSGHKGRLHVFVGCTPENPHWFYVFYVGDRSVHKWDSAFGDKGLLVDNREEGKVLAIKEAAKNDCIGITNKYGHITDENNWKFQGFESQAAMDADRKERSERGKRTQKDISNALR